MERLSACHEVLGIALLGGLILAVSAQAKSLVREVAAA
jgi:hypothetical protein